MPTRRTLLAAGLALPALARAAPAQARDPLRIGMITPLTGPFTSTGQSMQAAARLWLQQNGGAMAGRPVELIVRDDAGVADATRRLAQELILNDKAAAIVGMGLTPLALAVAPVATRAKVPLVVMGAATSSIPDASPFVVRSSFAVPQNAAIFGTWAARNGFRTIVSLVSDYGPGLDNETWFGRAFEAGGGRMAAALRVPLANPDFAPFLQRAADLRPDGLFVFVPSGVGGALARQYRERGLDRTGLKLLASGDVLDDQLLDGIGDVALGLVSAYHYSDAHDSAENRRFSGGFRAANGGMRANMMAVGAWDGMTLIARALERTGGGTDGTALVEAMKGQAWESPRGPVSIDPATRDIVQNVYLRRVERVGSELANVEFETFPAVRDPAKAAS